jgi:hypothetical protein
MSMPYYRRTKDKTPSPVPVKPLSGKLKLSPEDSKDGQYCTRRRIKKQDADCSILSQAWEIRQAKID